jgi:hypothetical protein
MRRPVHIAVYGIWGSGKSTFLSTLPKPMLVLMTDPPGKEAPYLRRGALGAQTQGAHLQPVQQVMSRKTPGKCLIQVEYFHDLNPRRPDAHNRMRDRLDELADTEIPVGKWATLVLDGITFSELNARKYAEHITLANAKDGRQWYAFSMHEVEEIVLKQLAFLPINVGVACHVDFDYDEVMGQRVHNPAAPGKLRARFGAGFPEMYVAHALTGKTGDASRYWLQTRTDTSYAAESVLLQAPNPCEPTFEALWANFDMPVAEAAPPADAGAPNGSGAPTEVESHG